MISTLSVQIKNYQLEEFIILDTALPAVRFDLEKVSIMLKEMLTQSHALLKG